MPSACGKLGFDRSLARRVRQEVEDHLRESAANDPTGDPLEAERRAIARFGDPQLIVTQLAAVSLARQAKRAGAAVIVVIAGALLAMKARTAWYAVMQAALSRGNEGLGSAVASLDRTAFWLAVILGIVGWAYRRARAVRRHAWTHPTAGSFGGSLPSAPWRQGR